MLTLIILYPTYFKLVMLDKSKDIHLHFLTEFTFFAIKKIMAESRQFRIGV